MARVRSILLVEKNPDQAMKLRRWLSVRGYSPQIARSYREACGTLARKRPDLILLGQVRDLFSLSEFLQHCLQKSGPTKIVVLEVPPDYRALAKVLSSQTTGRQRTGAKRVA